MRTGRARDRRSREAKDNLMDDVLFLIGEADEKDEFGVNHAVMLPPRMVYCRVASISRAEFFAGGRSGLNPSYQFKVFSGDYKGELIVEYRGKHYTVYRTYEEGDEIEIYVERRGGSNGASEDIAGKLREIYREDL